MKRFMIGLVLLVCAVACEPNDVMKREENDARIDWVVETIKQVEVRGDASLVLDAKKDIEALVNAVNHAVLIPGILNVAPSHFTLRFVNMDGSEKSVWLWLEANESDGMVMFVDDTHTGYTLLKEEKEILLTLLYGEKANN